MAEEGNKKAIRVWDGMKYQIVKYIGAMAAVLGGRVDGILLTGGLLRFEDITQTIREQCEWIAPVSTYPARSSTKRSPPERCASCAARKSPSTTPGVPSGTAGTTRTDGQTKEPQRLNCCG